MAFQAVIPVQDRPTPTISYAQQSPWKRGIRQRVLSQPLVYSLSDSAGVHDSVSQSS